MTKYFKVEKGTETFQKMQEVYEEIKRCNAINHDFAKSIGAKDGSLLTSSSYAAGGIVGFPMDKMPENWRNAGKNYYGYYFPKAGKKNKEILDKISALPSVRRSELGKTFGYDNFVCSPGIKWGKSMHLVEVPIGGFAGNYTPMLDMVELTGTEYLAWGQEVDMEMAIQ